MCFYVHKPGSSPTIMTASPHGLIVLQKPASVSLETLHRFGSGHRYGCGPVFDAGFGHGAMTLAQKLAQSHQPIEEGRPDHGRSVALLAHRSQAIALGLGHGGRINGRRERFDHRQICLGLSGFILCGQISAAGLFATVCGPVSLVCVVLADDKRAHVLPSSHRRARREPTST